MRFSQAASLLFVFLSCSYFVSHNVLSKPFLRSTAVENNCFESRPSLISSENIDNVTLKIDTKSVLFEVDDLFRDHQRKIDKFNTSKRCYRYGLDVYNGNPRRLFFGSMVADENWEVFQMHAIEAYDVYHVAVFVESNTTHTVTPRKLRFQNSEERDQILKSRLFGPKTNVVIDFWLEDWPELTYMDRESEQRNAIIHRWKKEGMTRDDVAIMADIDEVFSRDFLRALQTCDFPEFRPEQSCHRPKICPSTMSFEGTPLCIKKKDWFHPDVISGQCVEGIGDPTERIVPLRNHHRMYGERHETYGKLNLEKYPDHVHKVGRYPLFNGPDIRTVHGDRGMQYNWKHIDSNDTFGVYGVAYHFHNWFSDHLALRQKYLTYAHGDASIMKKTLSQGGEDLDLMVRCVRDIGNEANPNSWKRDYYEKGWEVKGPRPIFFQNKTYVKMRHALVQKMVHKDEAVYGSSYDEDNKWVENTLRSKVSSNQWKSIAKDSKSKPTILKPANGKNPLIKIPQGKS
jgi:Glycosyltransferase family 17